MNGRHAIHAQPSVPYGPLDAFHTAKPGNSKRSVTNIALNPEATADKSRETYRKTYDQFELVTLDTAFPQAARELAETSVAQTHAAYERSKNTLEAAVNTIARSFDALGQGVAALNLKIIEIAQQNVSSSFDLAKSLATAKTLAEIVELRATYWRKQLSALADQAEARVVHEGGGQHGGANAVTHSLDELREAK